MPAHSPPFAARAFALVSLVAAVATFVAVQVDFVLRHYPGVPPARYWTPQLRQIWLPGFGAAVLFAVVALALERRPRGQ